MLNQELFLYRQIFLPAFSSPKEFSNLYLEQGREHPGQPVALSSSRWAGQKRCHVYSAGFWSFLFAFPKATGTSLGGLERKDALFLP